MNLMVHFARERISLIPLKSVSREDFVSLAYVIRRDSVCQTGCVCSKFNSRRSTRVMSGEWLWLFWMSLSFRWLFQSFSVCEDAPFLQVCSRSARFDFTTIRICIGWVRPDSISRWDYTSLYYLCCCHLVPFRDIKHLVSHARNFEILCQACCIILS